MSDPTFLLFYCPVKAWNEFQKMLPNAASPALAWEGPKAAGVAAALPERGHGAAAGQADAAVPAQGTPGGSSVPIPGEHAVIVRAGLAAQALCSRVPEGAALVKAVLAAHGHGAQAAAGAALAGEAGLAWEEGSRRAAAAARAGLLQLQRGLQSGVAHLPCKRSQRGASASAAAGSRAAAHGREGSCPAPAQEQLLPVWETAPGSEVLPAPWAVHKKPNLASSLASPR